ncbi:MAG: hypothetical protein IKB50_01920, partial [Clostridia bacterium]|nr:hypothetical protein [Clostridia bacterium]
MQKIKNVCYVISFLTLLLMPLTIQGATSDALLVDDYYAMIKSEYNDSIDAPDTPPREQNVNLADGSFSVEETDLVIPGKNGLDVHFIRRFNSYSSCGEPEYIDNDGYKYDLPDMVGFYYDTYFEGEYVDTVLVAFQDERDALENQEFVGDHPKYKNDGTKRSPERYDEDSKGYEYYKFISAKDDDGVYTYKINPTRECRTLYRYTDTEYGFRYPASRIMDDFDHGWYLIKPGMGTHLKIKEDVDVMTYGVFQSIEGETLSWEGVFTIEPHEPVRGGFRFTNGEGYRFENAFDDIEEIAEHPSGFQYNFMIIQETTGVTYYFKLDTGSAKTYSYDLQGIGDKYGNIILYEDDKGRVFTDTYGNKINISKRVNTVDGKSVYSGEVTIGDSDEQETLIKYTHKPENDDIADPYDRFKVDDIYVFTVEKAEEGFDINETPNKTEYRMAQELVNNKIYNDSRDYVYYLQLMPLEIQYPDGLKRVYEYDVREAKVNKTLGKTSPRGDINGNCGYVTAVHDEDADGNIKNSYTYSYKFLPKTNSTYMDDHYIGYGLWSSKTTVTRTNDNQKKVYTFTGNSLSTNPQTRKLDTIATTYDGYTRNENFTFSKLKLSRHTITDYDSITPYNVTTRLDYDSHTNIVKEQQGDKIVEYTYDVPESKTDPVKRYSVMTSQTYNMDDDTIITVQNTLTEDRKSVASSSIYENDVLKSTTNYTYNTDGTVVSESITLSDGTTMLTTYEYEYYDNGTRKITKTIKNRVDADGTPTADITTSVVYDSMSNVIEETDGNGQHTYHEYDIQGRLLKTTFPDNTTVTYSYDIPNNTVISTDRNGNKLKYKYNAWGDLADVYAWSDSSWILLEHQEYDELCRPYILTVYKDDDTYYTVTTLYDGFDRVISQTLAENGNTVKTVSNEYSYTGDAANRTVTKVTSQLSDSNGNAPFYTDSTFDYRGLPLQKSAVSNESSITQSYTYDRVGNMLTFTDPKGAVTTYDYDYAGNVISATDAQGNTVNNGYDEAGRMIWSEDAEGNRTYYYYDTAGLNTKIVSPFGDNSTSTVKMYYDANGNVLSQMTQSNAPDEAISFDRADFAYDIMNNLSYTVSYPDSNTPQYTQYFYDANGNNTYMVTGLTAPISSVDNAPETAAVNAYIYDELNRVVSHTNPLGGTETYTYDLMGNVVSATDENGTTLAYTYNHDGNVTTISTSNVADGITPSTVSMSYNIFGLPSVKTVNGSSATYTYDNYGRVISETEGDITKNYTYDNNSNLLSIRVLNGADTIYSIDYTYDILNRLSVASAPDMTGLFAYTPNGNIATYTIDGVTTSYTYDNGGLLTGIAKGDELSETYTYAHNGNKILTLGTGTGIARNEYAYDGMGRLVHETADAFSASYTYDVFGNRATMQQTKDGVISNTAYTYDLNNRLTYLSNNNGTTIDEITYTYDNAGNMLYKIKGYFEPTSNTDVESISLTVGADPYVDAFSYNALGQLVSADMGGNISTYTYDADGIRNAITSNGV